MVGISANLRVGFGLVSAIALASTGIGELAFAQSSTPVISVELNNLKPSQNGCQITFVIKNDLGKKLEKAAYEVVLFDGKGLVDRMTIFDFQTLAVGKTKVRQFNLKGTDCEKISRILINGSKECKGVDADICMTNLITKNKTTIKFGS